MYSRLTRRSIAIVRMDVGLAREGTPLDERGASLSRPAIAHPINFDEPKKLKRTAA